MATAVADGDQHSYLTFIYICESQEKQQKENNPKLLTADLVYFCIASPPEQKWCLCQPLTKAANWNVACSYVSCKATFPQLKRTGYANPKLGGFVPTSSEHILIMSLPCSSQEHHEWNEA